MFLLLLFMLLELSQLTGQLSKPRFLGSNWCRRERHYIRT
ncbi:hypothetical protein GBAR_LOCUS11620 [Geodia barretti]|uniref:Uncharacterized protein n=1 Tax=Geodia barretti TaxID=519541 RepID=A0AA35WMF4_GEOBA|nr:hypothetical protein GBAR_LOCUS11620 [Geodia barretti]